jgi:hypothetical protein
MRWRWRRSWRSKGFEAVVMLVPPVSILPLHPDFLQV